MARGVIKHSFPSLPLFLAPLRLSIGRLTGFTFLPVRLLGILDSGIDSLSRPGPAVNPWFPKSQILLFLSDHWDSSFFFTLSAVSSHARYARPRAPPGLPDQDHHFIRPPLHLRDQVVAIASLSPFECVSFVALIFSFAPPLAGLPLSSVGFPRCACFSFP